MQGLRKGAEDTEMGKHNPVSVFPSWSHTTEV